ncbi:MAG: protein-S-isoprenylcysteine O-methyltransferase [Candidatus Methanofastidiosia archaeon]
MHTIFTWIYFIGLVIGSVIRVLYTKRSTTKEDIAKDYETKIDRFLVSLPALGMFVLPLVYALTTWLNFADYQVPVVTGWIGAVVYFVSFWLLWRSHADLQRSWTPSVQIRKEHTLVTHGVFIYIRHPMYAAHLLWGLAQPFLLWNWIAGFSMLVTQIPLYVYRIPREEKMMLNQFGEEYKSYMEKTGRFIPMFWK